MKKIDFLRGFVNIKLRISGGQPTSGETPGDELSTGNEERGDVSRQTEEIACPVMKVYSRAEDKKGNTYRAKDFLSRLPSPGYPRFFYRLLSPVSSPL